MQAIALNSNEVASDNFFNIFKMYTIDPFKSKWKSFYHPWEHGMRGNKMIRL